MALTGTKRGRLAIILVVAAVLVLPPLGAEWYAGRAVASDARAAEGEARDFLEATGEATRVNGLSGTADLEHAEYFGGDQREDGDVHVWQVRKWGLATRCVIGTEDDGEVTTRVVTPDGSDCDGVLGERPAPG